ncbi:UNVERIFIED_CONTAM: tripartite tricarboxylate transporter TctB family protein [Halobacillus marinus]
MDKQKLNIAFTIFLFALFTWAAITALSFSRLAQFFPIYVSTAGSIVTGLYLCSEIIKYVKQKDKKHQKVLIVQPLIYLAWIVGYVIMIYIIGVLAASAVFLMTFLVKESRFTIGKAAYSTGITIVALIVLSSFMKIAWPESLLGL